LRTPDNPVRGSYGFGAVGVGVMPGPVPKPPGQRRRRNKAVKAEQLPAISAKATPILPDSDGLLERTREWWKTVWSSPMAAVFLEADVAALARLASLVNRVHRGESSARLLGEIRALEDRFGLSPLARRRLQWEVDRAAAVAGGGAAVTETEERWRRVVSE